MQVSVFTHKKAVVYLIGIFYLVYFSFGSTFFLISRNSTSAIVWLFSTALLFFGIILLLFCSWKNSHLIISSVGDFSWFIIVISFSIGFILSFTTLVLSDDVYRYLFNTFLLEHGLNPNSILPSTVADLQFPYFTELFRPDIKNPYPLSMVGITYIINQLSGLEINSWRIVMTFLTLFVSLLLKKVLVLYEQSPNYIVFWAWNPIVLFEFSHSGHNDVIVILLLVFIIFLTKITDIDNRKGTQGFLGLLWGVSISLKVFPLFILPFFVHSLKKFGIFILLITGTLFLGLTVLFGDLGNGLINFLFQFRFNGGLFELIPLGLEFFVKIFSIPILIDKIVLKGLLRYIFLFLFLIALLFLIIYFYFKKYNADEFKRFEFGQLALLSFFIFSPIVHPWYLTWGLVLFVISPEKTVSYLMFSLLTLLSYFFYVCQCEDPYLLLLEYGLIYFFLIVNVVYLKFQPKEKVDVI